MGSSLKVALIGLLGIVVMGTGLLSWSYKNQGLLGSTQIPWSPMVWLTGIVILLLAPVYYCLSGRSGS